MYIKDCVFFLVLIMTDHNVSYFTTLHPNFKPIEISPESEIMLKMWVLVESRLWLNSDMIMFLDKINYIKN